jgi:hypothetical protein
MQFTNTTIILGLFLLFVAAAIGIGMYLLHRKTRTQAFRNRFGSEYDRAVLEHGSPRKAETKLANLQNRVEAMPIRDLGVTERDRFAAEWQTVQSRFVDHPKTAVTEADDLINALLLARGYPQSSFEQRAADVSVSYKGVMENYRLANAIAVRPGQPEASTEELRTAMIQYRAIFDELAQAQIPSTAKAAA